MRHSTFPAAILAFSLILLGVQPARTEGSTCTLLKASDLKVLLGENPTSKAAGSACSWSGAGGATLGLSSPKTPGDQAYAGARQGAVSSGAKVADEKGIGDKAFSVIASYGVSIVTVKKGKLLHLQYITKVQGTAKDLEALRPVAKKAIAAF